MKRLNSIWKSLFVVALAIAFTQCEKDNVNPDNNDTEQSITLELDAKYLYSRVEGIYEVGEPLDEDNRITLSLLVNEIGKYNIATAEQNGYHFEASGEFKETGEHEIILNGIGTPEKEQLDIVTLKISDSEKDKEIQVVSNLSNKIIISSYRDNIEMSNKTTAFGGRNQVYWQITGSSTSAAINNGVVFINLNGNIGAYDIITGEEKWLNQTLTNVEHITYGASNLYTTLYNGKLVKINPENGDVIWEYIPSSDREPGAAVVQNDVIYYGNDKLYAIGADKSLIWESISTAGGISTPLIENNTIYFTDNYNLFGLNISNGDTIWRKDIDYNLKGMPSISGGSIFVNGVNSYCFNSLTGEKTWEYSISDINFSPVVNNSKVYISRDYVASSVVSLDINTGEQISKFGSLGPVGDMVLHEGFIFIPCYAYIIAAHLDSEENITAILANSDQITSGSNYNVCAIYNKESKLITYPPTSGNKE